MGLLEDFGLRESSTKKSLEDKKQLMRCILEYKWLKDDQLQSKGKAPMISRPWHTGFSLRARGNLRIPEPEAQLERGGVGGVRSIGRACWGYAEGRELDRN
nr:hypothetical protein CFP56_35588 [Quercus suber]